MTELDIALGRKEIMHLLHVKDWGTVRSWHRNYNLPLRRLPHGQPFVLPSEVKNWLIKYSDLKAEAEKKRLFPYKIKKT